MAKEIKEGLIETYLHPNGKVGVLLDVRCQTYFAAKTEEFKDLVHELSLQIASISPNSVEELLNQDCIRNPDIKVKILLKECSKKLGENIMVKRFERYQI